MAVTALTPEQIQELLAGAKSRGDYDRELKAFIESESPGGEVDLENGVFAGKKAQSVKTGFENARKREGAPAEAEHVKVVMSGESVYLIRTDAGS